MSRSPKKGVKESRARFSGPGVKRFEVQGLEGDRDLLRALAKRLAANDAEAERVREQLRRVTATIETKGRGRILEALRRSPLGELDLSRERVELRKVDL